MTKPYIGITGFMKREEAEAVLKVVPAESKYDLMVGVLVSSKTLHGIPNNHPNQFPKPEAIKDIFPAHPKALNLIHYYTEDQSRLLDEMIRMTFLAGSCFHGFQLNLCWPDPKILNKYNRAGYASKHIVLQIGNAALGGVKHSPRKLARKLREYPMVDYVLLDPSGGYGKKLCPKTARNYLEELYEKNPSFKFVVAGGLNPDNLHIIEPLVEEFPELSIDVQSGVRDKNDNMDTAEAIRYTQKGLKIFN